MFLFPWLDWGDDISNFEKSIFGRSSDFERFQHPEEVIFYIGDLQSIGLTVAQKKNFEKIFRKFSKNF